MDTQALLMYFVERLFENDGLKVREKEEVIPRTFNCQNKIFTEKEIEKVANGIYLLEGVRGMGKTTFMKQTLERSMNSSYSKFFWFDFQKYLTFKKSVKDEFTLVRKSETKMPPLILMIDNVDDSFYGNQLQFLELIDSVLNTKFILKAFIAVTPNVCKFVQSKITVTVFTFIPLTIEEQGNYIDSLKLKPRAKNNFMLILKHVYNKQENDFFGTPFLMKTIATVVKKQFLSNEPALLTVLFDKFVVININDIHVTSNSRDQFIMYHLYHEAIKCVFAEYTNMFNSNFDTRVDNTLLLRLPMFHYNVYAFLAAKYILNNLKQEVSKVRVFMYDLLSSNILTHQRYKVFRIFFDVMLENERPLTTDLYFHMNNVDMFHITAENCLNIIKFILENLDPSCRKELLKNKNQDGNTVLHIGTIQKHIDLVKYFVEIGLEVDCKNSFEATVLHLAAEKGFIELAKFLIEHGANVNAQDKWNNTPLYNATLNKHFVIVQMLTTGRANLNMKNQLGHTVLPLAAALNEFNIVKYLVENSANINIQNELGETALHVAVKENFEDITVFLVENGASIDTKDYDNYRALTHAIRNNNLNMVKFLVEKGATYKDVDQSPLVQIFETPALHIVQYLIESGANINAKDPFGTDLLMKASEEGNFALAKYLLDNGSTVHSQDCYSYSALRYAVEIDNKLIVEYLLRHGANVNKKDGNGTSPLQFVVEADNWELVWMMLDTKCNPVMEKYLIDYLLQTKYKHLSIYEAIDKDNSELVWKIMGAEYKVRINNGIVDNNLVWDYLIESSTPKMDERILSYLLKYTTVEDNIKTPLQKAIHVDNSDLVWKMLKAISSLDYRIDDDVIDYIIKSTNKKNDGVKIEHMVAKCGNVQLLDHLKSVHLDYEIIDSKGNTPLFVAVEENNLEMVKYLLTMHVNVNSRNRRGQFVIDLARDSEMRNILLDAGAEKTQGYRRGIYYYKDSNKQ